jgi:hypothetical protein
MQRIHVAKDDRFSLQAIEHDDTVHTVPLHRVRCVWRNGEIIWQRPSVPTTARAGRARRRRYNSELRRRAARHTFI